MFYRVHRNYDPVTLKRGTESIVFYLYFFSVEIRWRSAEDGITPYWNVSAWRGTKILMDITLYDGDKS